MNNQLKTVVFLGGLSALLVVFGRMVAPDHWWLFGVGAVAMNIFGYYFSDKMVLKMNRAKQVTPEEAPELHRMVEELSVKAEIPKPKVFVVSDPAPNAFATGRNPSKGVVAVTTGIQQLLTERELRGVIAHELAHIKNRDILIASIATMAASAISLIAQMGFMFGGRSSRRRGGGPGLMILAMVAPIAGSIIQFAISRSREYIADKTGAEICGDPEALASALSKLNGGNLQQTLGALQTNPASASLYISNPLSGAGMRKFFSTHPPIPERVRRLMEMQVG